MSKRKKQAPGDPGDRSEAPPEDDAPEPTGFEPAPEGEGEAGNRQQTQVSPAPIVPDDDQEPTLESSPSVDDASGEGAGGPPSEDQEPADADDEATQEVATLEPLAGHEAGDEAAHEAGDEEGETLEMSIDAGAAGDEALDAPSAAATDASGESGEPTAETLSEEDLLPGTDDDPPEQWEEPTRVAEAEQLAELAARTVVEPGMGDNGEPLQVESQARLESIIESLLFAAERPLNLADLKRLVNERDAKKLIAALGALQARHQQMGIQLASAAGGWQFRTHPDNATWVAKMVAGRPARLSRAMLETLAIVAYRQPITRPEIDEIRGVDCGPVLKTLLDRALIRMIGKKEEVGRPILYGTTPEFLRTFSLKDLTELPTLRQFHELGVAEQAKVDAEAPTSGKSASVDAAAAGAGAGPRAMPAPTKLPEHDPAEEDALLAELDDATASATRATRSPDPQPPVPGDSPEASD